MEFTYVFKDGQGIQANEDNSTYYVVKQNVVTNNPDEMVPVLVRTEYGNPYDGNVKAKDLAALCAQFDTWMTK